MYSIYQYCQSLFATKWYLPLLISALFLAQAALAVDPVYVDGRTKTAIRGYDTVAYFTQNKPIKGSKEFTTKYQGAIWRFSSAENLQKFIDNPKKYAPQYGGYCAYAIARNTTASIKPAYFTILDDKLYLNYNRGVQKRWLKKKRAYIKKANKNWPEILKK